jgi:hypothetical protein
MEPQQFRPIILKTLKDGAAKKYASMEELADRIVERMQDFQEMLELAGGSQVLIQTSPQPTQSNNAGIVLPTADISERIRPRQAEEQQVGIVENFSKDELYDYYTKNMPPDIVVQPEGFKEPLKLIRFVKRAPGDIGFVRVGYAPPGADQDVESVQTMASTTDSKLDYIEILSSLTKQAQARYRATRSRVEPVRPPILASLEAGLAGSPSMDTDEQSSGSDMASWGGSVAGKAADDWLARRK